MGDGGERSPRWRWGAAALGALGFLGLGAVGLQRRSAAIAAREVGAGSVVVLLAGASDADRRLEALRALCTGRSDPLVVFVGDDDELDDDTGRAWGPLLVDRVAGLVPGCLAPRLVPGRVRTTGEELDALAALFDREPLAPTTPVVVLTSPYHRARVDLGFARRPALAAHPRRFLALDARVDDFAPHTVIAEGLRLARDAVGLSDLLGRRTLDRVRTHTPWPRPTGTR